MIINVYLYIVIYQKKKSPQLLTAQPVDPKPEASRTVADNSYKNIKKNIKIQFFSKFKQTSNNHKPDIRRLRGKKFFHK